MEAKGQLTWNIGIDSPHTLWLTANLSHIRVAYRTAIQVSLLLSMT